MKALRRSFLWSKSNEYAILAKAFSFWRAFLQRSYMGLKCQFIIKMDTQKLFRITAGDGNFTNVNLNFLCYVRKKMATSPMLIWISCVELVRRCGFARFAFRRLSVNHLNKVFEFFSRSCNTLLKFMLDEWGVLSSA